MDAGTSISFQASMHAIGSCDADIKEQASESTTCIDAWE